MSQPIHYIKDSQLFTVVIENISSFVDGRQERRDLGTVGGRKWIFDFEQKLQRQVPITKVSIVYYGYLEREAYFDVHYGFHIGSQDDRISHLFHLRRTLKPYYSARSGNNFLLSGFLDENNGYLKDGKLEIQVEIRVLAIIDKEGIRSFNFHDPFEGCVTVTGGDNKFYVDKTLISHHCAFFANQISKGESEINIYISNRDFVEAFLQLLHGVPLEIDSIKTLSAVIQLAHSFGANNVLQYCFNELKNNHTCWDAPIHRLPMNRVEYFFKTVKSVEEFRICTRKMRTLLYEMNSEMLKAIVKKFFSFAADNDDNDKITVSE